MLDSDVDMANLPIAGCIDNCRNYLFIAGGAVALHQSRDRAGAVQTAEDIGTVKVAVLVTVILSGAKDLLLRSTGEKNPSGGA